MAFLQDIRDALGIPNEPEDPIVALPGNLGPETFIEHADAPKPPGYQSQVELALQHYFGLAESDTRTALATAFPRTAGKMVPVQLRYVRFVVDKQAAVFAGSPKFELMDANDQPITEAGGVKWSEVIARCELKRRLQQVNRRTLLCRTAAVRITWDADCGEVRLTTFTPDKVHILAAEDSRSLNEAAGVLLDLEPRYEGKRVVRRWEFWSAGGGDPLQARNFIIDENGDISAIADGLNPYRDDNGAPVVPIVLFCEDDDDAGPWPMPSESLLATARALNVKATALNHLQGVQSFGQWISEVNANEEPEPWSGEPLQDSNPSMVDQLLRRRRTQAGMVIEVGPDTLLQVPKGRTLKNIAPQLDLTDQAAANDHFLRQSLTFENCPPGEMLSESRATSGFQLVVERLGLTELRTDQLERYRRSTEDVIELVRIVHDAHQPSNATRFGPCCSRFTPGAVDTPVDPQTENATDAFLLANKLSTRAQIIARREGISLDAAAEQVKRIDEEGSPAEEKTE